MAVMLCMCLIAKKQGQVPKKPEHSGYRALYKRVLIDALL